MRRLWHRFVGHRFERVCRLCMEVRFHINGCEHEMRCRCGEKQQVAS
jgi:hypothetical protein